LIQDLIQTTARSSAARSSAARSSATAFKVRETCAALGGSCSGFYAHRHKAQRQRRREDRILGAEMEKLFDDSAFDGSADSQERGTYGSPRLVRALRKEGFRTSKTRVSCLMKSRGLQPGQKRRVRVRTTCSDPHRPVAPHLLLNAPPAYRPGERFQSDITYIPTDQGTLYLAATIDAYSRKCLGWSAADNMESPLVVRAAWGTLTNVDPNDTNDSVENHVKTPIHHSDRGSQYASEMFRDFLRSNGITQSMSRKANCYDNALMESFWATLKTECFDNFRNRIPATHQEAKQKIFRYIEVFYNRKRLHSSLDYCSPCEFEENYRLQNQRQNQLQSQSQNLK